jgi:hypothetical protein
LCRENVETYPLFLQRISCLALIPGESGDSSLDLGFARKEVCASYPGFLERFPDEILKSSQIAKQGSIWASLSVLPAYLG